MLRKVFKYNERIKSLISEVDILFNNIERPVINIEIFIFHLKRELPELVMDLESFIKANPLTEAERSNLKEKLNSIYPQLWELFDFKISIERFIKLLEKEFKKNTY